MILVVGGIASGKRSFLQSIGYAPADCSPDVLDPAAVLLDAQDIARDEDVALPELAARIAQTKQAVTFTEVGLGIVPVDAGERAWRERAGGFSRLLADEAQVVVRMTCGIPQVIKGTLDSADVAASAGAAADAAGASGQLPAHSFFSNRACQYFPCHDGIDESEFNCLFCYCPLYALGPECGGQFTYTRKGKKSCVNCPVPHRRDAGAQLVADHYAQLAELAARRNG